MSLRVVVWATCFTGAFFTTGPIFGWPALQLMLLDEGVYADTCGDPAENIHCPERFTKLNQIFSAGFFTLLAGRLGWGIFLDSVGPRKAASSACLVVAIGALLMAFSTPELDLLLPGAALIGLGGPGIHCSNFQVSNLFPERKRMVTSSFSGIFGTSGLVFAIFRIFYNLGATLSQIFVFYAALTCFIGCTFWFVQPAQSFKPGARVVKLGRLCTPVQISMPSSDASAGNVAPAPTAPASAPPAQPSYWRSVFRQVLSVKAIGMTIFFSVHFLQLQFYLGNANYMLSKVGDDGTYAMLFNVLGSSAIVWTPCVGGFLDRVDFDKAFAVVTILAVIFNVLSHIEVLEVQIATFIFWTVARLLLFASYFSFLPATFGFKTFGSLQGITSLGSALFCLLNFPLTALAMNSDCHALIMWVSLGVIVLSATFPIVLRSLRLSAAKQAQPTDTGVKTESVPAKEGQEPSNPSTGDAHPASAADAKDLPPPEPSVGDAAPVSPA